MSLGTQFPPQSCRPSGQTPWHGSLSPMQFPAQSFLSPGQRLPQTLPLQVAEPPTGTGQLVQEPPQFAGSMSLTQASPQR